MTNKIGIDLNGVLRDINLKISQVYEKNYIETYSEDYSDGIKTYTLDMSGNTELDEQSESFKYEMSLPVTSLNLMEHFKFQNEDDFYNFLYEDFAMQIFGHSPSTELNSFVVLNDIIESTKGKYEFSIFSKEFSKSKPASLFFISKFGCIIDSVIFYNNNNLQNKLSDYDVIVTANPDLIKLYPEKCIKYVTTYNEGTMCNSEIVTLKELINKIEEIKHVDLI